MDPFQFRDCDYFLGAFVFESAGLIESEVETQLKRHSPTILIIQLLSEFPAAGAAAPSGTSADGQTAHRHFDTIPTTIMGGSQWGC